MSGLPDDRLESAELRDEVKMAMEELADDLREPIILFHYGEMTYEEIAELLGVSRATISARLAKARQQLARRLVHLMR